MALNFMSSYFSFLSAGITGVCHLAWKGILYLYIEFFKVAFYLSCVSVYEYMAEACEWGSEVNLELVLFL